MNSSRYLLEFGNGWMAAINIRLGPCRASSRNLGMRRRGASSSKNIPTSAAIPTAAPPKLPEPTTAPSAVAIAPASPALSGPITLPGLVIAAIPEGLPAYRRETWNHRWIDADGDCQDTRAEVLIEESTVAVNFGIGGRCTVNGGQWLVPFTGTTVGFARLLDIVHMVPLVNAHRSGAWAWSSQNKGDYFNNLSFDGHLIAVALTVVRSRGASGPEDWQPPNMGYWCEYSVNWIQVKAAWNLNVTADEWSALEKMLGTCSADLAIEIGEPITVAKTPAGSALPTPTPSPAPTATPTQTPTPTPAPLPTPAQMTKQEVEALAALRVEGLVGANLPGIDLSGANLPAANFHRAYLAGADLTGANLVGAILQRADLSGADLSNADLRFAELNGANLSGADLTGANLSKATLSQADLSKADLSEAFPLTARLFNTNLTGTNLAKTDWNNAYCRNPATDQNFLCTLEELQAAGALAALTDPPHRFSGIALIDPDLAPDGPTVIATIGATEVASTKVTTGGSYKFRIHQPPGQSFAGKEITFKVGGFSALATATWEAGGENLLNLRTPGR